jgi:predicted nucleic acid-binding Zn ribbon protein
MIKRFAAYFLRWQLSSPILAIVIAIVKGSPNWFGTAEDWYSAAIANAIGACIFFWVDKFIFTSAAVEMWHFIPEGNCDECGNRTELWRLTLAPGYDKRTDEPKYLCMECSKKQTDKLRAKGIKIKGRSH